jgi:tRNA(Ile2) C34 agmatinyltransferase TiaS
MVDWSAHKKAHKLEMCPACGGMMHLGFDTYRCEKCGHFEQDPSLHDIVERDDPANLKYCNCDHCLKGRNGVRL